MSVVFRVVVVFGVILIISGCTYSEGDRVGYVQKISSKGWICKTWEGELQVMPVPGSIPEKFFFSVSGDDVAKKIEAVVGKKVALHYKQRPGVPSCFGDTQYFINAVNVKE